MNTISEIPYDGISAGFPRYSKASPPSRLFRFVRLLVRRDIRGAERLVRLCRPIWDNSVVIYELSPSITLAVPIGRRENCWDLREVIEYESRLLQAFCAAVRPLSDVTLVDCGADIGVFSALVCSRCDRVTRVVALEPNPAVRDMLSRNIACLPNGEARYLAVSNFEGFGKLESPAYDNSDHARYLIPARSGFPVTMVDSLGFLGGDVAIKIDVEGGEIDVLRGAAETVRQSRNCVVTLEAHPKVFGRTGLSPSACMTFLEEIRPFRFLIAEDCRQVKASDNVIDAARTLNIIAVSERNS
jgi:FkbM family methyltransferase